MGVWSVECGVWSEECNIAPNTIGADDPIRFCRKTVFTELSSNVFITAATCGEHE